jgi:hypothetical protein
LARVKSRHLVEDERGRLEFDAPALADAGEHVAEVGEAGAVDLQFIVGRAGNIYRHSRQSRIAAASSPSA